MKDQENMVNAAKFHTPSQLAAAVSSGQYIAEHCYETK